jgi:hypothetical protein
VDGKLWNIGIRVADVEKEVSYFKALGAVLRVQEKLATKDGQFEYALLDFGDTRLFLTPKTAFEHATDQSGAFLGSSRKSPRAGAAMR